MRSFLLFRSLSTSKNTNIFCKKRSSVLFEYIQNPSTSLIFFKNKFDYLEKHYPDLLFKTVVEAKFNNIECNSCKKRFNPPAPSIIQESPLIDIIRVYSLLVPVLEERSLKSRLSLFDPDLIICKQRFLELQSSIHPDKVSSQNNNDTLFYEAWSMWINEAWQVLKCPLSRAISFFTLNNQSASVDDDPGLLNQVLSLRERLASDDSLSILQQDLDELWDTDLASLRQAIVIDESILITKYINRLKYWQAMRRDLRESDAKT